MAKSFKDLFNEVKNLYSNVYDWAMYEKPHVNGDMLEVDNPGKGDCGFFSIAKGIIPHLQAELVANQQDENKATPCWDAISKYFDKGIKESMKAGVLTYDYSVDRDPPEQLVLLHEFNLALRRATVDRYLTIFKNHESNNTLDDAYGVFCKYFTQDKEYKTNSDFGRNAEFRKAMRVLAAKIKKEGKTLSAEEFKNLMLKNIDKVTWDSSPANESAFIKVIKRKLELKTWATDTELSQLGNYLGHHVEIYVKGKRMVNIPVDHKNHFSKLKKPIIHLNKPNAYHWRNFIDPWPKMNAVNRQIYKTMRAYQRALAYCKYMKSEQLSKSEIKNIMQAYTGLTFSKNGHEKYHKESARPNSILALQIYNMCDDDKISTNDIMQLIADNESEINAKKDKIFPDIINYLQMRQSLGTKQVLTISKLKKTPSLFESFKSSLWDSKKGEEDLTKESNVSSKKNQLK